MTNIYSINSDKITYRIIDNEAIILNLNNGIYYSLNKLGTLIWQQISAEKSLEQILDLLEARFREVGRKKLEKDLRALVDSLLRQSIIYKK